MSTAILPSNSHSPASQRHSLAKRFSWLTARERVIEAGLAACAILSVFTTVGIIAVLASEAIEFFKAASIWEFLTETRWTPQF
jgi:phosphate transport system permease protein